MRCPYEQQDLAVEDSMFADVMLESWWAQRSRRSWTTLTSFGLQAIVGGLLLLLPMLRTVGLPAYRALSTPISLGRPAPAPSSPRPQTGGPSTPLNPEVIHLMAPPRIPITVDTGADEAQPHLPGAPFGDRLSNDAQTGLPPGLLSIPGGTRVVMPPTPPAPIARAIRTSSMLEGNLIRRVQPTYPRLARRRRIERSVDLAAVSSK